MLKKNDIITLEITDISNDGNGVGKYNSIAVFVPNSAIGDVCEVKILKVLSSYCFGKIEKFIALSNDRINPACPCFLQCGGCDFLHISYDAEKKAKHNIVKSCFERICKTSAPVLPTLSCDKHFRYRNKAQFPVRPDENGKAITGFFAPRSHRIIPCPDCLLQPNILNEIAQYTVFLLNRYGIKAYDETNFSGLVRHIYLRKAEVTGEIMLCIVSTSQDIPNINNLAKAIVEKFCEIKTIVININSKNTNVILGEKNINILSDGTIQDVLSNVKITLSPHSFYQVNHDAAQELYSIAENMLALTKDDILLDLYCGAGTIGLSMASKVSDVIGVEIVLEAIENAIDNAKVNNIDNAKFICADAGNATLQLAENNFKPTAIVLDPSRKGCDETALKAIVDMSPEKIAMISCNPATAARDCKYLADNGYEIQYIQPYDMFPRTKHVEAVVLLSHKNS